MNIEVGNYVEISIPEKWLAFQNYDGEIGMVEKVDETVCPPQAWVRLSARVIFVADIEMLTQLLWCEY